MVLEYHVDTFVKSIAKSFKIKIIIFTIINKIKMASRVGTYLSDDNMKKLCIEHMSPGSKTYGLFKLASSNAMAQRPKNVSQALTSISKLQNTQYNSLVNKYIDTIKQIPNESIMVYTQVGRVPQSVLEATGSVGLPQPLRPVATGAVSRPLIQGASTVFGQEQPTEGNLVEGISINSPTPTETERARLLQEQTGRTPIQLSQRAVITADAIKDGRILPYNLSLLSKPELYAILDQFRGLPSGSVSGQERKDDLIRRVELLKFEISGEGSSEEPKLEEQPEE